MDIDQMERYLNKNSYKDYKMEKEKIEEIFDKAYLTQNKDDIIMGSMNALTSMVENNLDYVFSCETENIDMMKIVNNRGERFHIANRFFDAIYGIKMNADCDVSLKIGLEDVFTFHCKKDEMVMFHIPIITILLQFRDVLFKIQKKGDLEVSQIKFYGIFFYPALRSFMAKNNIVIDRFFYLNGELYQIVPNDVSYVSEDFDYSKNTKIDTYHTKWIHLRLSHLYRKEEMERITQRNEIIRNELIEKIWNPLHIQRMADYYHTSFMNLVEILS